jgi:hypothetical protein
MIEKTEQTFLRDILDNEKEVLELVIFDQKNNHYNECSKNKLAPSWGKKDGNKDLKVKNMDKKTYMSPKSNSVKRKGTEME